MATGANVTSFLNKHKSLGLTLARLLDYDFAVLDEHRKQMDASLKSVIWEFDKRWIQIRNDLKPDDARRMALTEEYHEAAELLPRLQWSAQLVLAYSTFEHCLNQLCLAAKARVGSPHSLYDFQQQQKKKDQGIFLARSYLIKIAGIKAPFSSPAWGFALKINKLRNVIVHSNGEFFDPPTAKQTEVQTLFKDDARLRVIMGLNGEPQRFRLTPELVQAAIAALAQVVKDVCAEEPSANVAL